jgi:hypothetical protein
MVRARGPFLVVLPTPPRNHDLSRPGSFDFGPGRGDGSAMDGRLLAFALAASLLLAGCGGSSGGSEANVQKHVLQYVKDSVGKPDVTVDEPQCSKSGSEWNCDVLLHAPGGKTKQIQVQASCDGDTCRYALVSVG